MATRETVNALISSCYGKIESLQAQDRELAEKIERLQTALHAVKGVYEDDKSFVSWLDGYDVGAAWQGNRREEFEELKRTAKAAGDTYCDQVWEIHEGISRKIRQLEGQRWDIGWQITFAYGSIGSLQASLAFLPAS